MLIAIFCMSLKILKGVGHRPTSDNTEGVGWILTYPTRMATIAHGVFPFLPSTRYIIAMMVRRFMHTLALFAALCIALTSVASAARMAPTPAPTADVQAFLDSGGALDDLCIMGDVDHADHDCPFCRLISDSERLTPMPASWLLIPHRVDYRLTDLTTHHQLYMLAIAARGPPCLG